MAFVPMTPEEQNQWKQPCSSQEHNPPNMMVYTHAMKWVCPSCGKATIVRPRICQIAG